jgi:hypothetical protein
MIAASMRKAVSSRPTLLRNFFRSSLAATVATA